ncbi:hypothetical protein ACGFIU_00720 [Rhodococcus oryzae]|uniref:hypothetical protein n=1 Tax=Rhodococcus oryzae TaxID=2571143 RepID=UPI00371E6CCB
MGLFGHMSSRSKQRANDKVMAMRQSAAEEAFRYTEERGRELHDLSKKALAEGNLALAAELDMEAGACLGAAADLWVKKTLAR